MPWLMASCLLLGFTLFLILFLIPSMILKALMGRRIPYLILLFLWLLSLLVFCAYIHVHALGGACPEFLSWIRLNTA